MRGTEADMQKKADTMEGFIVLSIAFFVFVIFIALPIFCGYVIYLMMGCDDEEF